MTTAIAIPELEPVLKEHAPLLSQAEQIQEVATSLQFELAARCKQAIYARRRWIEDWFRPMKQAAKKAHESVCDHERMVVTQLKAHEDRLGSLMADYDTAQERQRALAQKQAQEDAQVAEAAHYELMGDTVLADAALGGEGTIQVTIPKLTPKVDGTSFRETYSAEVTNLLALVVAVAKGQVPLDAIQANQSFLSMQARSLKTSLTYPGVRVVVSKTAVSRR